MNLLPEKIRIVAQARRYPPSDMAVVTEMDTRRSGNGAAPDLEIVRGFLRLRALKMHQVPDARKRQP